MRTTIRNTAAVMAALALVLGLGACGGSEEKPKTQATQQVNKDAGDTCFVDYDDPEMRMGLTRDKVRQQLTDSGLSDDDVSRIDGPNWEPFDPICIVRGNEMRYIDNSDSDYVLYAFQVLNSKLVPKDYYWIRSVSIDPQGVLWRCTPEGCSEIESTIVGTKSDKRKPHHVKITKIRYGNAAPVKFTPLYKRNVPSRYITSDQEQ